MIGRLFSSKKIPHRGKHLDVFDANDIFCVAFSKVGSKCTHVFLWLDVHYHPVVFFFLII